MSHICQFAIQQRFIGCMADVFKKLFIQHRFTRWYGVDRTQYIDHFGRTVSDVVSDGCILKGGKYGQHNNDNLEQEKANSRLIGQ